MGSGQSTAKRSEFEQDLLIEIDQLYKVASTRSQLFYKKLVGSDNVKEYHIRKVCDYSFRIFVGVTITEELTTQVGDIIGTFMDGDWKDGLIKSFKTALQFVLETGAANENEAQSSYVFAKGAGVFKIDYYLYNRCTEYKANGQPKSTNITSVAYVLSSVDCTDLCLSDFNSIVANRTFYRALNDGTREKIIDEDVLLPLQVKFAKDVAKANGIKLNRRSPIDDFRPIDRSSDIDPDE